jgi:hypothetical protein
MRARKHEQASQAAFCHHSIGPQKLALGRSWEKSWSGHTRSMSPSGLLKDLRLIGLLRLPNGVAHARPNIGQGSDRDGMALALGSLALLLLLRPGFLMGTLPGKLVPGIAPGLAAAQPRLRCLVRPALQEDWRGASQGLQAARTGIPAAILAQFGQQSRSKTRSSPWQSLEELAVGVTQKKALDLLVVGGTLLEQRFHLVEQGQHQPRCGACRDLIGVQTSQREGLDDLLCFLFGPRISGPLEQRSQVLHRGGASCLHSRRGTQEGERPGVLQLAEHFEGDRVIGFEAGRELVDQAGLHLDQRVLVAGQGFELLDRLTVGTLADAAPGSRRDRFSPAKRRHW